MRVIVIVFLALIVQSCIATQAKKDVIQLNTLYKEKSALNNQKLKIAGLLVIQYGSHHLKKDKDSNDHIDLVFMSDDFLIKEGCIIAEGVFIEFNDKSIGIGKLSSKHGLIEVSSLEYIKCES